jgi:hypothetical protein
MGMAKGMQRKGVAITSEWNRWQQTSFGLRSVIVGQMGVSCSHQVSFCTEGSEQVEACGGL